MTNGATDMSGKRILLLYNETSGKLSDPVDLHQVLEQLALRGCWVTVYPIHPSLGLASEVALAGDLDGFDVIACCGGDGTLNHVVSYMMAHGIRKPIGYIPAGSTNDFSRSLNGGDLLSVEDQCAAIAGDHTFSYDVGAINDRYFNYIAAFGAFTKVSYETPQNLKNRFGHSAYIMRVVATIPTDIQYRVHARVRYDDRQVEGDYIFGGVVNSLSVGGVQSPVISLAELNDGRFELVLIEAPKTLLDLNAVLAQLGRGESGNGQVLVASARHVEFEFDDVVPWTLDGEEGTSGRTATIDCLQRAMSVLVR